MENQKKIYIKITEQPASGSIRFRYETEQRKSCWLRGATREKHTVPAIKIEGYKGAAFVVVSCVTVQEPHRPHPYSLVGEDCVDGVCCKKINDCSQEIFFRKITVQCVKKTEVESALRKRESRNIDPFMSMNISPTLRLIFLY